MSAVGGTADEIELAFYEAMQAADLEQMMNCWADEDDMVCVHPNGPRVVGLPAIRATFEAIFSHGPLLAKPEQVRRVESLVSAVHNVVERVTIKTPTGPHDVFVIATNVYHKTAKGWRIVLHHASPGTADEVHDVSDKPQILH